MLLLYIMVDPSVSPNLQNISSPLTMDYSDLAINPRRCNLHPSDPLISWALIENTITRVCELHNLIAFSFGNSTTLPILPHLQLPRQNGGNLNFWLILI